MVLFVAISCSKDDEGPKAPVEGGVSTLNGITEEALGVYAGDLGLIINARNLADKGYLNLRAEVSTGAQSGDFDQSISIDPMTSMGTLKFAVEALSAEAANELAEGVDLQVKILDADTSAELTNQSFSAVNFKANGTEIEIDAANVADKYLQAALAPDLPYFLQLVDANGNYGVKVMALPGNSSLDTGNPGAYGEDSIFADAWVNHQYLFARVSPNSDLYVMYTRHNKRYVTVNTYGEGAYVGLNEPTGLRYDPSADLEALPDQFKFSIRKEPNGFYTVRNAVGAPMTIFDNQFYLGSLQAVPQYFRLLAFPVAYDIQGIETRNLEPIWPKAQTSFSFNSTLVNCGTGEFSQAVGIEKTLETTIRASWEKSNSLTTSHEGRVDIGATVELSPKFFGFGAATEVSLDIGYTFTSTSTQASVQLNDTTLVQSHTFFSNRTVTVPPKKATLVFDAYQTYSNVQVPFVQKLRIKGVNTYSQNANSLTGAEMASIVLMNGVNVVINKIGPDYVDVVQHGTYFIDNLVQSKSEARDVAASCD